MSQNVDHDYPPGGNDHNVALARLNEVYELLHVVTAERDDALNTSKAIEGAYHNTIRIAEKALAECERLSAERDTLENEIQTVRDVAHTIRQSPLTAAAMLLVSSFLRKETTRE